MKRCSQCEFVYEDEQGVCDMDGSELVDEPTLYPPATNSTTTSPPKFRSRSFFLTAAATLIMGTFLAIGFYGVSSRTPEPRSAVTPVAAETAPPSVVVQPAMEATPESKDTEPAREADSREDAKPKSASSATAKPSPSGTRTTTTREAKKPAPAQPKKEDSKVGGLLKKTGRILKKPFKF